MKLVWGGNDVCSEEGDYFVLLTDDRLDAERETEREDLASTYMYWVERD